MKATDLCCLYEYTMLLFLLIITAFDFVNWLVDGGWSSWNSWNQCTVTCRGGTRRRSRSCTNPPAAHGGKTCSGQHLEIEKCNNDVFCPGNNEVAATQNNFCSHLFWYCWWPWGDLSSEEYDSAFYIQQAGELEMIEVSGPKVWLTNCLFGCSFFLGMLAPREKNISFCYIQKVLLLVYMIILWMFFSLDQSSCFRLTRSSQITAIYCKLNNIIFNSSNYNLNIVKEMFLCFKPCE